MPRLSAVGISGLQAGEDVKDNAVRDLVAVFGLDKAQYIEDEQ